MSIPDSPDPAERTRLYKRLTPVIVFVMLLLHLILAANSVRYKSNTFDELDHLTAGYSYWKLNDYRLNPENGNFPQRWASLPLLFQNLNFPGFDNNPNVRMIAHEFFFRLGNDANIMLFQSRMMIVVLSLLLGLGVYFWSAHLFGPFGGLISLTLYCFSPTILAHARLTTSDLSATLFFLFALGAIWRVLHRVTVESVATASLAVTGLLLSKMSGVLIIPTSILMVLFRILCGTDQPMVLGKMRRIRTRAGQAGIAAGAALVVALVSIALIWGAYGFRFTASPDPVPGQAYSFPDWPEHVARVGGLKGSITFLRDTRILPEAYLYGFSYVLSNAKARPAFLAGRYSETGWWYFFPFCFLVKTPLSTFLVIGIALLALMCVKRRDDVYAFSPLLFLFAVYGGVAITSNINIGHRHILPIYPVLFILCGAAARWYRVYKRTFLALSPLIAMVLILETQSIWPHYLAFFNSAAGGPQNGYRLLVDSSLDWGQDLPGLAIWIKERRNAGDDKIPFYLAYFGTASPIYHQVRANIIYSLPLPWTMDVDRWELLPRPGYYCISATELQQDYSLENRWLDEYEKAYQASRKVLKDFIDGVGDHGTRGIPAAGPGGNKKIGRVLRSYSRLRFVRLCAVLRQRNPDASIGHSILIYLVSQKELDRVP